MASPGSNPATGVLIRRSSRIQFRNANTRGNGSNGENGGNKGKFVESVSNLPPKPNLNVNRKGKQIAMENEQNCTENSDSILGSGPDYAKIDQVSPNSTRLGTDLSSKSITFVVNASVDDIASNQKSDLEKSNETVNLGILNPKKSANAEIFYLVDNRAIIDRNRLSFIPDIDKEMYCFSEDEVVKEIKEWETTLIGVIIGPNISLKIFYEFVKANWKITCPKVFLRENGVWIMKFAKIEDRKWVMDNGPWLIGGFKPLMLKEWYPGTVFSWSAFDSVLTWAILPNLDPIFHSAHMLSVIGSVIGIHVCMDKRTTSKSRLPFARILVEVDAKQAKRSEVNLKGPDGKMF